MQALFLLTLKDSAISAAILFVGDGSLLRFSLMLLFKLECYRMHATENGAEALAQQNRRDEPSARSITAPDGVRARSSRPLGRRVTPLTRQQLSRKATARFHAVAIALSSSSEYVSRSWTSTSRPS
jgi:hypothetical protein